MSQQMPKIPKNLRYQSKVQSAAARSFKSNISPQAGSSFTLGSTVLLNVPTRPNLYMAPSESYLKFTMMPLKSTAADSMIRFDSSAHGIFSKIRIFSGGNLLEEINEYSMLAKILFDLQVSTPQVHGKMSVNAGTRNDLSVDLAGASSTAAGGDAAGVNTYINANLRVPVSAKAVGSGMLLKSAGTAGAGILANNAETLSYTFCLNLISLVGSLSPQYIPLAFMKSSPLRIELTIADAVEKIFCCAGTSLPTCTAGIIKDVEFIASMVELSDESQSIVNASLQGQPLQYVFSGYRNFQNSFQASTNTTVNLPIAAKYTSLKSLLLTQRDNNTGALTFFPQSSVKFNLASYQFRIGPSVVPPTAPTTVAEFFSEALKAVGSLSDINHSPAVDIDTYSLNDSVANTKAAETHGASNINSGSFVIGCDLESYQGAPKSELFSGYNSNSDDIYAMLTYGTVASSKVLRYDCFANFDALLICDNDTAYVRS